MSALTESPMWVLLQQMASYNNEELTPTFLFKKLKNKFDEIPDNVKFLMVLKSEDNQYMVYDFLNKSIEVSETFKLNSELEYFIASNFAIPAKYNVSTIYVTPYLIDVMEEHLCQLQGT